jgi:hypothetical protein
MRRRLTNSVISPSTKRSIEVGRRLMRFPTSVEPGLEFVVTATLIVADVARSTAFYRDVPGAVDESGPSVNRT